VFVVTARSGAVARTLRNELIRVRNAQNDVVELGGDVTDVRVREVIRNRYTADVTVGVHAVPLRRFGLVVVFPVGRQQTGVLKRVRSEIRVTDKVSLAGDFNAVEAVVDLLSGTHFRL